MKRIIVLIAAFAAVASVAAFAEGQQQAPGTVKLTWSTASVPGDAHTEAIPVFKAELERLSDGAMTVEYYHSGQLFSQNDDQNACMMGKVDMVYSSAAWLAQLVPTMSMFAAAFTFQSYNQMTKTFNGPVGERVFGEAVKLGYRPLMAYYLGTRQINLTEKVGPVTKPEQMKNVKFRVPNAPAWIAMGRALGANPTPMSFGEVYMGLKTGVIDGQDNPLPTDQAAKFYEVTKYIVLTDHVVDSVWPTMNEKKWQSLSKKQQGWVMKALEKGREFCDTTNLNKEKTILDFFKQQGLIVVDKPDKKAFAAYAKNYYATEGKDISKNWDWALYDQIQKIK